MLATRTLCAVGLAAPVSVTVIRRTEFDFRVLELYVRDPSCILLPKTPGRDHPLQRRQISDHILFLRVAQRSIQNHVVVIDQRAQIWKSPIMIEPALMMRE